MMGIVGTGLQAREFRVVLQSPGPLIGSTISQVLLLPLGAIILISAPFGSGRYFWTT
jgi:hypothetical protein